MKIENIESFVNDIFTTFIHYFTRINLKPVIHVDCYKNDVNKY
jgi:hypothetical protein